MRAMHKLIVVSAMFCTTWAFADVVVVVSAKSPVGNLTAEQVSQLFLGKTSTFPGGAQAMPIDQAEGQPPRDEFYTKITGKSAAQVKAYWSKIIFTGKGQPPRELPNTAEVKKMVSANPNTIGYIEKSAVDSSVKVVLSE
ncbi:MAG: phosphate ABC transporter substrate-binding protein [Burkholderiales bacterium]|jgi:ABC-type phosphate transport system substrate-binding protein